MQTALFMRVRWLLPAKWASLVWAIPNGGLRHMKVARDMTAEGAYASAPDIVVMIPTARSPALCLEMKRPGEKPTEDQTACHERLRGLGFAVLVCESVDVAWRAIVDRVDGATEERQAARGTGGFGISARGEADCPLSRDLDGDGGCVAKVARAARDSPAGRDAVHHEDGD